MPNWCECELQIEGYLKELARFREFAKSRPLEGEEKVLSEEPFIPYPEKFRELDRVAHEYEERYPEDWKGRPKDGFNQGGYEWCVENWGTKWGFCHPKLITDEGHILRYGFGAAWSPPLPLIKKMGEMFPSLRFYLDYWEGGMGFQGTYIVEGGKVVQSSGDDYHSSKGG